MISSSRGGPDSSLSRWGKRGIQLSLSGWPRVCGTLETPGHRAALPPAAHPAAARAPSQGQAPPGSGFRRRGGFSSPGRDFRSPECRIHGASTPRHRD